MNYPTAITAAAALLAIAIGLASYAPSQATSHDAGVYTLIRDRNVGTVWRMHVATGRLEACRAFNLYEEDASKVTGYCALIAD